MMRGGIRLVAGWLLFVLAVLLPLPSHAFCGFYVNTGNEPLFNDATRVALMRVGMRTVLSIQNDYKGPLENFALIVPVPVVLERANVRTLPRSIFERVDKLTGPRLVEYWEEDPCYAAMESNKEGGTGTRAKGDEGSMGASNRRPLVTVEREFSVDEYDVVVLSARDSGALETWLHDNNYVIPPGAEPYFRPYVQDGSKFFVAKVDISRVHFRWGRAQLSPLRFFYDTPEFILPIRLGLINSSGVQDLIVYVLAGDRYETANYDNKLIPTNLAVKDEVRSKFNSFYAALYDQTVGDSKRSVVTEYSWSPQSCDPCPQGAGPLAPEDTALLGGDVVPALPSSLVLTRLHARFAKSAVGDDLRFKVAPPIEGGREGSNHGATPSSSNNFQGRFVIRHLWDGPLNCSRAEFGKWGGRSPYGYDAPPRASLNPHADRHIELADYVLDAAAERRLLEGSRFPTFGARMTGILRVDQWDSSTIRGVAGASFVLGFLVAAIVAWRRKLGVWKTLGLFLLVSALGFALAHGVVTSSFTGSGFTRAFMREPLLFVGLAIAATGFSVARPERRVAWGFFITVAGLAETARYLVRLRTILAESGDLSLGQLGRIYAEVISEDNEVIAVGCALGGVLALLACFLENPRGRWTSAVRMIPVAVVMRGILLERDILLVDVIVVLAFSVAAIVVCRSERLTPVVVATAALVLVDLASKLMAESHALDRAASDAITTENLTNVLLAMRTGERKRLLLIALDIGLLVSLAWKLPDRRVYWRVLAPIALLVLAPALSFDLFGFRGLLRSLDSEHARFGTLSGPALYVRSQQLLASPSNDAPPVPYTPAVAEKMAVAEEGIPPLLFTDGKSPLSDVLAALQPLLRGQQTDYRIVASAAPPQGLDAFGLLVTAHGVDPASINVVAAVTVVEGAAPAGRRTNAKYGTAFRDDGHGITARAYVLDPAGIRDAGRLVRTGLEPKEDQPYYELQAAIQKETANNEAIVAFPPNTPLERISLVLSWIQPFKIPRVLLTSDVAALDRLR